MPRSFLVKSNLKTEQHFHARSLYEQKNRLDDSDHFQHVQTFEPRAHHSPDDILYQDKRSPTYVEINDYWHHGKFPFYGKHISRFYTPPEKDMNFNTISPPLEKPLIKEETRPAHVESHLYERKLVERHTNEIVVVHPSDHHIQHHPTVDLKVNSELEDKKSPPRQQTVSKTDKNSKSPRRFSCKYCEKDYMSLGALKMHIRTHTLPCKCNICGKAFSRPWLLQGHIRTHTGERPFGCSYCGRAFADRSNLRAHIQTHTQVKKYECRFCSKTFSRASLLKKHEANDCLANIGRPET
uniref:Snail n=1 Tax=Clytia hemisphaerica TaxID=252671 RepID=A0A7G7H6M3_9CNID|nr:snail [Clytia hemisphaerica]